VIVSGTAGQARCRGLQSLAARLVYSLIHLIRSVILLHKGRASEAIAEGLVALVYDATPDTACVGGLEEHYVRKAYAAPTMILRTQVGDIATEARLSSIYATSRRPRAIQRAITFPLTLHHHVPYGIICLITICLSRDGSSFIGRLSIWVYCMHATMASHGVLATD
jgi:hypothetical protein